VQGVGRSAAVILTMNPSIPCIEGGHIIVDWTPPLILPSILLGVQCILLPPFRSWNEELERSVSGSAHLV